MQALRIVAILLALICAVPLRAEAGGRVRSRLRATPTLKIVRYNFARSTPGPGATVGLSGEPVTVVRDEPELVCQDGTCVTVAANQLGANASGAQIYGVGTNLLSTSEMSGTNLSIEAALAPDGTMTAYKVTKLTDTVAAVNLSFTSTAARHTGEIWVKGDSSTAISFGLYVSGWMAQTGYLVDGSATCVANAALYIDCTSIPTDRWVRLASTSAANLAAGSALFKIYPNGTGGGIGKSIYLWRPQVEAAVVPSPARAVSGAPLSWPATAVTVANPLDHAEPWAIRFTVTKLTTVGHGSLLTVAGANGFVLGSSATGQIVLTVTDAASGTKTWTTDAAVTAGSRDVAAFSDGRIYVDGTLAAATAGGTGTGLITCPMATTAKIGDALNGRIATVALCRGCTALGQMQ